MSKVLGMPASQAKEIIPLDRRLTYFLTWDIWLIKIRMTGHWLQVVPIKRTSLTCVAQSLEFVLIQFGVDRPFKLSENCRCRNRCLAAQYVQRGSSGGGRVQVPWQDRNILRSAPSTELMHLSAKEVDWWLYLYSAPLSSCGSRILPWDCHRGIITAFPVLFCFEWGNCHLLLWVIWGLLRRRGEQPYSFLQGDSEMVLTLTCNFSPLKLKVMGPPYWSLQLDTQMLITSDFPSGQKLGVRKTSAKWLLRF